jgi:hypothetical protein
MIWNKWRLSQNKYRWLALAFAWVIISETIGWKLVSWEIAMLKEYMDQQ